MRSKEISSSPTVRATHIRRPTPPFESKGEPVMSVPQFDTEKSPPSRGRRKLAAVVPLAALLVACGSAADESPTDTDTGDGTSDAVSGSLVVWDWKSGDSATARSEEHTSELQSRGHLVCRL